MKARAVAMMAVLAFSALPAHAAEQIVESSDRILATNVAPRVEAGDLAHLVFTATGTLPAGLIAPQPFGVTTRLFTRVDVQTVAGAGIELSVNGTVVPASQLGERMVDAELKTARYAFYAVPFKPGPNDVAVTALGAGGARGTTVHSTVFGSGRSVRVAATLDGAPVADGHSSNHLTLVASDAWHHPAMLNMPVRVAIVAGDATLAKPGDTRTGTSSLEVGLDDRGTAGVLLLPGTKSGNVTLAVTSGEARITKTIFVEPFLRRALVTGLVTLGVGAVPGDRDGDGYVDAGGSRRARAALFVTGAVAKHTSLAFAYDTASHLAPTTATGPYVENPDDRPFQTYGDASTRRDDALSAARMYARVERGRSSYTYGRFSADLGGNGASSFQQVLSGSRLELADSADRVHVVGFRARNDVAYARETLDVTGLAFLGKTLHPSIVVGSEIITLVALDRTTGGIVSQRVLERSSDYVLDYTSGALRFVQVPLPYDANLNRQIVVVQYQYAGDGHASVAGGKLNLRLGRDGASTLRLGYVNDASGAGNFTLFEQAIGGVLPSGGWSLTHASANGFATNGSGLDATAGSSIRFALATTVAGTRLALAAESTGAGFHNPYGAFATPGFGNYRASFTRATGNKGELTLAFDAQGNHGVGNTASQSSTSLKLRQPFGKRLTMTGGIDLRHQSGEATLPVVASPSPDGTVAVTAPGAGNGIALVSTVTQASIGAEYKLRDRSTLSLSRTLDVGGSAGSSLAQPAQTQAGFDLSIDASTHAYLRELWTAGAQSSFAAASSSVGAISNGTHLTTFGVDRKLGPNTSVTTQYTLQNTGNGTDMYVLNGVREVLRFSEKLKGDAFVQNARSTSATVGGPGGFNAYGFTLAYGSQRFHASTAFQERTGSAGGYSLQLGAGGALSPDLSLVGSLNSALAGTFKTIDGRAGIAWRPHGNDRGAALFEVERRTSNLTLGTDVTDTLAIEGAYRPTGRLEIDSRLAYKLDGDRFYAAHSMLFGTRAVQRIGARADVALEARTVRIAGIAGATTTALAAEGGFRVGDSMRIAGGYHFSGIADPSLAAAPQRRGMYLTMTSAVSHLFGFGK